MTLHLNNFSISRIIEILSFVPVRLSNDLIFFLENCRGSKIACKTKALKPNETHTENSPGMDTP